MGRSGACVGLFVLPLLPTRSRVLLCSLQTTRRNVTMKAGNWCALCWCWQCRRAAQSACQGDTPWGSLVGGGDGSCRLILTSNSASA